MTCPFNNYCLNCSAEEPPKDKASHQISAAQNASTGPQIAQKSKDNLQGNTQSATLGEQLAKCQILSTTQTSQNSLLCFTKKREKAADVGCRAKLGKLLEKNDTNSS